MPMARAPRLRLATATVGVITAAVGLGATPSHAQTCNGSGTPPFTCTGTLTNGTESISFSLPEPLDFTAFTSNFDPSDPVPNGADPLLELYDVSNLLLAMNDDGGGDYLLAHGTLFSANVLGTTYTAGNVFDALIEDVPLPAGAYRLDVVQSTFGDDYRVHLEAVSPD